MSEGCDYAYGWQPGTGARLKAAGKAFACRYLSGGGSKDLKAAERDDLLQAGVAIALVWETDGRTGPLMGGKGGDLDAPAAIHQAQSLGAPAGTGLYFAVDFDPSASSLPVLAAYADACSRHCHSAGYRSGIYGGLATVKACSGHCDLLWQTYAWSGGQWFAGNALEQYRNGVALLGLTVDLDRAKLSDFGQWEPPMDQPAFDALLGTSTLYTNAVKQSALQRDEITALRYRIVELCYERYLGRTADWPGLQSWAAIIEQGSWEKFLSQLLATAEAKAYAQTGDASAAVTAHPGSIAVPASYRGAGIPPPAAPGP
jgi:Domain of unknown function (DUF1906)